jgi:hypothetical protein
MDASRQRRLDYAKRIAMAIFNNKEIPSTWRSNFDSQTDSEITYKFHNYEFGYYATFDKGTGKLVGISDNYHDWKGWSYSDSIYQYL